MERLSIIVFSLMVLSACTETAVPELSVGDDELAVSIEDSDISTKSILSDDNKTSFSSGDRIYVIDTGGKSAVFKYWAKRMEGEEMMSVFLKESADEGFDKKNVKAAFYPAGEVTYSGGTFRASFSEEQKYAQNSFASGSAPMACFNTDGGKIKFRNMFAVVCIPIRYESMPVTALSVGTIELTASSSCLNGTFDFTSSGVTYVGGGTGSLSLTGCESAGALNTDAKSFYMAVPGLATSSEPMTVTVTPTTDETFSGTFNANDGTHNRIVQNSILMMESFVLRPIVSGGFTVDDWNVTPNIKVGQITVTKSEVEVAAGSSVSVQLGGISDFSKVSIVDKGGLGVNFDAEKVEVPKPGQPSEYYIKITGKSAGTGKIFINDGLTNSGSYIKISVK